MISLPRSLGYLRPNGFNVRPFPHPRTFLRLVLICALGLFASGASETCIAQTAHFAGVECIVASNGLSHFHQVTVDSAGNVYIADGGNNRVLKEMPTANGYQEAVIASGLDTPSGVAVDASGNVFITDSGDAKVFEETPSGSAYIQTVLPITGLSFPASIALDTADNLYISDIDNAQVVKETPSGGIYISSLVVGGFVPDGIAVDASDNVYVCEVENNRVVKMTPDGSGYSLSYVGSVLLSPDGVAVDALGDLYITESGSGLIVKETPDGSTYNQTAVVGTAAVPGAIAIDANGSLYFNEPAVGTILKLAQGGVNFGSVAVNSPSSTVSLTFNIDSTGPISVPAVVTQGIAGLDFTDAGTGSCTTNGANYSYTLNATCTVDVTFKPKFAGARYGAALLESGSGNVIATGYVQGIGIGPQVSFPPGVQSTLSLSNVTNPYAVAVDGAANLYIANAIVGYDPSNSVIKETWNGGGYTQTTVATGLGFPTGVAVDGAGNVYIADQDNLVVLKETPSASGGYTQSVVDNTLGTVAGIAVDGAGNVYVGRGGIGVEKETLVNGAYVGSEIFSTFYADGIAVDEAGDLYIAASGGNLGQALLKEIPSGASYVQSTIGTGLIGPHAVALDGAGNLFVVDGYGSNSRVVEETPAAGGYTQFVVSSGLNAPLSIAVDGTDNVYFSSDQADNVWKLDYVDAPTLSFATTPYGSTSSDSPQNVTLANIGNAALTFPVPASGNNPNISPSFTLNSEGSSACPLVDAGSSAPGTLAAGASCQLSIGFAPAAVGAISGSLVLTDNALNVTTPSYAAQVISLSGTGAQATPSITWPAPAAITYGTALSSTELDATASAPGSLTYSPAAGTVLEVGPQTLTATFTPTDAIDYADASANVTLSVSKATPANSLTSSANPTYVGAPVTFTATVTSAAGTPTGTVSFYDGTTLLGSGTLSSGVAAYTTSALTSGTHSIVAAYAGDSKFAAVTSSAVGQVVEDFTVATPSGGSTSATASPGGQAVYSLAIDPPSGDTFADPVTFTVTGLPTGATAIFSPSAIPAGAGATNVTLTVTLPASGAVTPIAEPVGGGTLSIALGLVLLPLAGLRKMRRRLNRAGWVLVLAVTGAVLIAAISGCGGSSSSSTRAQSYTLTVTASSASLSHQSTLTLTVEN